MYAGERAMRLAKRLVRAAQAALREFRVTDGGPAPTETEAVTARIGGDWENAPYYAEAEKDMESGWNNLIWPMIKECDFSTVVDVAAGHGRNTEKLRQHAQRVIVSDILASNVAFCRRRFAGDPRIEFHHSDGVSLRGLRDGSVSLIYSFDAMVHFDSDTIRAYLKDFRRVLRPGGRGFCHHSNFVGAPSGDFHKSDHWRNFMSKELFEHYCHKEGLRVLDAKVIDWNHPKLDCLTLVEKPR